MNLLYLCAHFLQNRVNSGDRGGRLNIFFSYVSYPGLVTLRQPFFSDSCRLGVAPEFIDVKIRLES